MIFILTINHFFFFFDFRSLRYLFSCLQNEAKAVWPDEAEIPSRVVRFVMFSKLQNFRSFHEDLLFSPFSILMESCQIRKIEILFFQIIAIHYHFILNLFFQF